MTRSDSELSLAARTDAGPDRYDFQSAAGLPAADAFRDADLALLDALWGRDLGRLCVPQANYGVLPAVLAASAVRVDATETSARAADCCRRNCRANDATVAVSLVAALADLDASFDTVAFAPRAYAPLAVGKQRLAEALAKLPGDGDCFVAGTAESGLERYADCLRGLGATVEPVPTAPDATVLRATPPETLDPPTFVEPRTLEPTVDGVDLTLQTVPGLFSPGHLDHGTRLLAGTATLADGDRVLDLCCGYGALGAWAGRAADCTVSCTDDDRRATRCASASLDASGVDGTVVTADGVAGVRDRTFDVVCCNPPTHAGESVLADLCTGARDVLASDGRLWLVHHRALDLDPHLRRFAAVERVAAGEEHVVVRARPAGD